MDAAITLDERILQPFIAATNSSTLNKALENLIELARTKEGRSDLASKNMLNPTLQLCKLLSYPSSGDTLLLALKLIRNLCAGELRNQNSFMKQNGVDIVSDIISSKEIVNDSNHGGLIRMGLQVLANVSLAGEEHQLVIWNHIYTLKFLEIAKIRRKETCDPLCMIIYACIEENHELLDKLCSDRVLPLLVEIIRSASEVGFGEDWLKLILSRTCIEESYFTPIFSNLQYPPSIETTNTFTQEQSFLLSILSEMINEQLEHITLSKLFALDIFKILKTSLGVVDYASRPKSGLPTGSNDIDALGYSLCILRDICAFDPRNKEGHVDMLLSLGFIETFLDLLRELEPPSIIRKTIKHDENEETKTHLGKLCPYKGFRSDIVAVIGNCAYGRKRVQDDVREKNGILLMLQHCVTDDENPFLREWGIWGVRNLLEGNVENQRVVSELEIQGSVNLPELSNLGLRVDVDQLTRRAKLVNMA
ncbi:unnamed protein product [Lactuca virosa]|uniref:Ataxin-10 domain-containing protein n=1 Tax=Lactuca virosa TaxID=75947 RepID=A0AAU9N069_9ASTR|nr:unnamed protein product [Lactuca virosa]